MLVFKPLVLCGFCISPTKTTTEVIPVITCPIPIIGGHHEVEQQPDGLLHINLVGGGQPLVELVVDGRQDSLQPRHVDLSVVVQRVEPVVTKRFDHVPNIHQMNCEGGGTDMVWSDCDCVCIVGTNISIGCHNRWNERKIFLRLHLFCTNRSLQAVLYVDSLITSKFWAPAKEKG